MDAVNYQQVSENYKNLIDAITNFDFAQLKLYFVSVQQKIQNKQNNFHSQYKNLKQMLQETKQAKGKVALHYACARGNVDIVAYMIQQIKVDYYIKDKQGNNGYFTVVQHGHYGLLRYFIQQLKVNINITKQGQINSLHIAANHNYIDIMQYLITNGINIEKISIYGKPINWAVGSQNIEATQILLSHGADPNGDNTCPSPAPIILAIDYENHPIYQKLINKQVNLQVKDPQGYSTLHLAAEKGNLEIVKDLLLRGVSVTYENYGKTAFQLAFEKQKWNVVSFLREKTPQYQKIQNKIIQNKKKQQKNEFNIDLAQKIKLEGNNLYTNNNFQQALVKYKQALKHNIHNEVIHRNIAACYLALKKYQQALEHCQEAKNHGEKNIKTLYREAQAYIGLGNLAEASASLWQCSTFSPQNEYFRIQFQKYFKLAKLQYENKK